MPATEETYRSQPTLHLVFAISSIAMLLATIWMVMADHLRPWKQVQRQFQEVERGKLKAAEAEKLAEQNTKLKAQIDQKDQEIAAAESEARTADRADQIRDLDKKLRMLEGSAEDLDTKRRFQKVDLDSKRSLYDGMIDRGAEREARTYLATVVRDSTILTVDYQLINDGTMAVGLISSFDAQLDGEIDENDFDGFVTELKKVQQSLCDKPVAMSLKTYGNVLVIGNVRLPEHADSESWSSRTVIGGRYTLLGDKPLPKPKVSGRSLCEQ